MKTQTAESIKSQRATAPAAVLPTVAGAFGNIASLTRELAKPFAELAQARAEEKDAPEFLANLENDRRVIREAVKNGTREKPQLDALERKIKQVHDKAAERQSAMTGMGEVVKDLKAKLARETLHVALLSGDGKADSEERTAVLANQQAVAEAQKTVDGLTKAVGEQQALIASKRALLPEVSVSQLELQREDLLAAIALGQGDAAALDTLEQQIAAQTALRQQTGPEISRAEKTIAGLSRKVEEAQAALQSLQSNSNNLLRKLLLSEAEVIGADYAAAALVAAEKYKQISALQNILGGSPSLIPRQGRLTLPCLGLETNKPHADRVREHLIFADDGFLRSELQAWSQAETNRLRAAGIDIG